MNKPANIQSSGLLKKTQKAKGPVAQMNENLAMIDILRSKRDALKTK